MLIWNLSALISYKDGSWASSEVRNNFSSGPDVSALPQIVSLISNLGLTPKSAVPDPTITSFVYRFSVMGTNGITYVCSGIEGIVETDGLQEIAAELAADPDFSSYFISQFVIGDISFSAVNGKPVLVKSVLNGQPGYQFALGDCLETKTSISGDFTVVAVITNIDSPSPIVGKILTLGTGYLDMVGENMLGYENNGLHLIGLSSYLTSPAIVLRQRANRADLWVNGGMSQAGTIAGAVINKLVLGNVVQGISGYFLNIAVYTSALSITAVNQVYAQIAATYGLTISTATEAP